MKKIIITTTILMLSSLLSATEDLGVLIQGEVSSKVYIQSVEVTSGEGYTKTVEKPGTYTVGDAIYLLKDGTCLRRVSELISIEALLPEGIDSISLSQKSQTVNCPSGT